ncbi:MAG: hypothetical protein IJR50_01130, partial [Treponema sp.]|nr:hypothetical protein [Treponema sp.]
TFNFTGTANGGATGSGSVTGATVRMLDMDGDGLADQVLRLPGANGSIYVKRNLMGGANLLSVIKSSTGAQWEVEYGLKYGTPQMPQAKHVMARLTVRDGCGEHGRGTIPHGEHSVTTRYEYEDGYLVKTTYRIACSKAVVFSE